jgi:hypothetical protein
MPCCVTLMDSEINKKNFFAKSVYNLRTIILILITFLLEALAQIC